MWAMNAALMLSRNVVWLRAVGLALTVSWGLGGAAVRSAGAQETAPSSKPAAESAFSTNTIDLGVVVADVEKSVKWYVDVVGCKELAPFTVAGDYGKKVSLTDNQTLHVRVLVLGDEPNATKLKLMQFPQAPGARADQRFIHSTYGFRYLTIFVKDLNAAVEKAKRANAKPLGDSPTTLPEGLPQDLGLAVFRDPDGNFVELVGPFQK